MAITSLLVGIPASSGAKTLTKPSKPVISGYAIDPITGSESPTAGVDSPTVILYNTGGVVDIRASVSGTNVWTFTSNRALPGLPSSGSGNGPTGEQQVTIPANTRKRNIVYKIKLVATDQNNRRARGVVTITVSPTPPPTGPLHVLPGSTFYFIYDTVNDYCDVLHFDGATMTDDLAGIKATYQQTTSSLTIAGSDFGGGIEGAFAWSPADNDFFGNFTFSYGPPGQEDTILYPVPNDYSCQEGSL